MIPSLLLIAACGGAEVTPVVAPEPSPVVSPSPVAPQVPSVGASTADSIAIATFCEGDPRTVAWSNWEPDAPRTGCLLPWAPSDGLAPWSEALGWVDLDLVGMSCGDPVDSFELKLRNPTELYIRLPALEPAPLLRRRIMRGRSEDGGYEYEGFGEWEPVAFSGTGPVIEVPMKALTTGANHWVQLEIQVGELVRTFELVWPVSC